MSALKVSLKYIFNILWYALTIISAVALLLALASSIVAPETLWWLSIFGLAAPVIIFLNIAFALFWTFRWKSVALVSVVVLLVTSSKIGDYYSLSLLKDYPQNSKYTFSVSSYNIMGFRNNIILENQPETSVDSIAAFAKASQIDILCLQEFYATPKHKATEVNQIFSYYPYRAVHYTSPWGDDMGQGLAIYSKFPIIHSELISSNKRINGAIFADLQVGSDTVRVFNCHLQTNSIDSRDRSFVSDSLMHTNIDSVALDKSKSIIYKLKESYVMRQKQVDSLSLMIHESPYPQIVCGDFNDVPISYAYDKMRGDLQDCFTERGDGYGYTFNEFMRMLRIDYILCSDKLEVITYDSPKLPYSDHNPIVSLMEMKRD